MRILVPSRKLRDEIAQMDLAQMSQVLESLTNSMARCQDLDDDVSEQISRVIDELWEQIGERYTDYRGE